MAEPSGPQAEAATDPGPEVKPEMIQDLDVTDDDADDIRGGQCRGKIAENLYIRSVTFVLG